MLKNFLKVAFRNLAQNKKYTIINIVGLSVALACCIVAYLNYEFSYGFDMFHQNAAEIYCVNSAKTADNAEQLWAITPLPLATAMQKDIPGIKRRVRISTGEAVMRYGDKVFEETIYYADNEFFEMFTFPLKLGKPDAHRDKSSIILSEETAIKYFGETNPVGRQLTLTHQSGAVYEFTVGAVAQKIPDNSSIQFRFLLPYSHFENLPYIDFEDWGQLGAATFIQVPDAGRIPEVERQLPSYLTLQNAASPDWEITRFYIEPLQTMAPMSVHMFGNVLKEGVHPAAIVAPSIIAVLLLLMACFNFMNTSIAFSVRRLKEIGVRKVLGARRLQLILQFMGENSLLCAIALFFSLGLAEVFVPAYSSLLYFIDLKLVYLENLDFIGFLALLLLITSLFAGAYPAYYISNYQPVNIIKGQQKIGGTNPVMRVLMTLQFALSILAIISGIVFTQNANYQLGLDIGYEKEKVIVIPLDDGSDFAAYRDAVKQNPGIISVAGSSHHFRLSRIPVMAAYAESEAVVSLFEVGDYFVETMALRLLAGRDFYPDVETDLGTSIIVNRKLAREFGWAEGRSVENAVGQQISIDGQQFTIAGVVEDFFDRGLWHYMTPCVLRLTMPKHFNFISVKTSSENIVAANELLTAEWQRLFPDKPYEGFYQDEVMSPEITINRSIKTIFFYISLIATVITIVGLFALVSMNISKRTKEIGIRKILGASFFNIGKLVNKEFLILLIVASALASVSGYFLVSVFLDSIYAYHIGVGVAPFAVSILIALLLSGITVGSQVYKVAASNPIEALRHE